MMGAARRVPVPEPARARLYETVPWRPGTREIPTDTLLLGLQNRMPASQFAEEHGDLLWPSTPVSQGPHTELLRLAGEDGVLSDDAILTSPYATLARRCIASRGFFFTATNDAGIVEVARNFIGRHRGEPVVGLGPHQSPADGAIRVAPVRWSDSYQLLDGHHRVASAVIRGERTVTARVKWAPVTTPLQETLNRMSWLEGEQLLYQPLESPELKKSWTTVRSCTDRLDAMLQLLADRDLTPPATTSYLDVASCYGWFVAQMGARGYDAQGIERDPLARPLGAAAYGLDPAQIDIGDAVELLAAPKQQWDVVSCFSLLHHFELGRASVGAAELARLLDKSTRRVLFLDTGQDDEQWFRESLAGWNPAHIRSFLRENTTFDEIIDLGPDSDRVPPFEQNYGRHLFACVRASSA